VIVRFADFGEIVEHHCLIILFIIIRGGRGRGGRDRMIVGFTTT